LIIIAEVTTGVEDENSVTMLGAIVVVGVLLSRLGLSFRSCVEEDLVEFVFVVAFVFLSLGTLGALVFLIPVSQNFHVTFARAFSCTALAERLNTTYV
jgi:hypothetical protein